MSWINGAGFIDSNNKSGPFFQKREIEGRRAVLLRDLTIAEQRVWYPGTAQRGDYHPPDLGVSRREHWDNPFGVDDDVRQRCRKDDLDGLITL